MASMNDRNLLFGARRELLKTGSISRLRASYQQLESESDKKAASIRHFGKTVSDNGLLRQPAPGFRSSAGRCLDLGEGEGF